MKINKKILLTFDLEEFDLPEEYGICIEKKHQLEISRKGLEIIQGILDNHQIRATFFTTAFFAENYPDLILELVKKGHEIASHSYYHSEHQPELIKKSKEKLEEIIHHPVRGFRSPRLEQISHRIISEAGFSYDSSLNPTYIPGRYNHLSKPRTWFTEPVNGLIIFPLSVLPLIRFPLFWLTFKNISPVIYLLMCKLTLKRDNYLHVYFHPWEFTDISRYRIHWFIKQRSGWMMANRLNKFIQKMKQKAEFTTLSRFISDSIKPCSIN